MVIGGFKYLKITEIINLIMSVHVTWKLEDSFDDTGGKKSDTRIILAPFFFSYSEYVAV
jgi:hypothetical protein